MRWGILICLVIIIAGGNTGYSFLNNRDYPVGSIIWTYTSTGGWDNSIKAIAHIQDINGDGISDVVIGGDNYYIRCLSGWANGSGMVIWEHEIYSGPLEYQNDIAIADDINGDGISEIVVGACGGARLIRMISGIDGTEIWTHDTHEYGGGGWVYQVNCSYDYNGDGIKDVLAATGDDSTDTGPKRVYCLDALTGDSIWECPIGGAIFSVIGVDDFTNDGQPDVVAGATDSNEMNGWICGIDGSNGQILWTYVTAGSSVWALEQTDDINGDGIKDIIAGDFYGHIYGINPVNGNILYTNSLGSGINIITRFAKLNDVNGDGYHDFVPAHSTLHTVVCIDGKNGNFIWSHAVADQPWNVDRIADISGDGIDDVIVGTLYNNNYCYFLNGTDGSEIISIPYGEAVDGIASIPDVTGDGSMEILAGGRNGLLTCFSGGENASSANTPPLSPLINGTSTGREGVEYSFSIYSTDPDGDNISYYIKWGEGNTTTTPFYPSGLWVNVSHAWMENGTYEIMAKAIDENGGQSDWSYFYIEITAEAEFNFSLLHGWNFITLPLHSNYTASLLYSMMPNCSMILAWNASLQDFIAYAPGSPNDFFIQDGYGYFIAINNGSMFNITGMPVESVNITLLPGWNALGWFKDGVTNARSILENITSCNTVLVWNTSTKDFVVYINGSPYNPVIHKGDGFFVAVTQQSKWHGEG